MNVFVTGVFDSSSKVRCVHCIENTNEPNKRTAVCFVPLGTDIKAGDKAFVSKYQYNGGWYTKLRKDKV